MFFVLFLRIIGSAGVKAEEYMPAQRGVMCVCVCVFAVDVLAQALDVAGWTSLHIAVLMGRREVVVLLLTAGAPPHVRTRKPLLSHTATARMRASLLSARTLDEVVSDYALATCVTRHSADVCVCVCVCCRSLAHSHAFSLVGIPP